MTISNGYATLAEFKLYASARGATASTDANDDTVIEDIIEFVSRWIEGQTSRKFIIESSASTRYFESEDGLTVYTDEISSAANITSVSVDYEGMMETYTALTVTTDYFALPDNAAALGLPITGFEIAPTTSNYFPTTRRGIQVVAKFGWATVPDNIKVDCLAIALNIYKERSGQAAVGQVQITAAGVVVRPDNVPSWVMSDLRRYRIIT